jgi:signal peptidase II
MAVLLALDFFSKWAASHGIFTGSMRELPLFTDVLGVSLSLTCVYNTGIAWGFLQGFAGGLFIVRVLMIGALGVYLFFRKSNILSLVLVGALGNVIDYVLYGSVVDFIHFRFWGYSFPVFNFADSYITIGAFLLFFSPSTQKELNSI